MSHYVHPDSLEIGKEYKVKERAIHFPNRVGILRVVVESDMAILSDSIDAYAVWAVKADNLEPV